MHVKELAKIFKMWDTVPEERKKALYKACEDDVETLYGFVRNL